MVNRYVVCETTNQRLELERPSGQCSEIEKDREYNVSLKRATIS